MKICFIVLGVLLVCFGNWILFKYYEALNEARKSEIDYIAACTAMITNKYNDIKKN